MKRFHLGKLLFKYNAGKEKGIPIIDIFRYLFRIMFCGRSAYMQMKTGVFDSGFSKNTIYHFLNNAQTNWPCFTALLSASIINGFMKPLTDDKRKYVFIIDDTVWPLTFQNGKITLFIQIAILFAHYPHGLRPDTQSLH